MGKHLHRDFQRLRNKPSLGISFGRLEIVDNGYTGAPRRNETRINVCNLTVRSSISVRQWCDVLPMMCVPVRACLFGFRPRHTVVFIVNLGNGSSSEPGPPASTWYHRRGFYKDERHRRYTVNSGFASTKKFPVSREVRTLPL